MPIDIIIRYGAFPVLFFALGAAMGAIAIAMAHKDGKEYLIENYRLMTEEIRALEKELTEEVNYWHTQTIECEREHGRIYYLTPRTQALEM